MPPQRTFPSVKPLKTERTHEENQERAYIAASRRSDRSLEARVESARRASEIHKRRTGRSLRVTEQDVINEEMYEEEDDDIPSQYRRLTAHLQTNSVEFNRRLQTYLTNHIAMRSALNDAIHSNFSQHYPNAPTFAHNNSMFPPQSPMMAPGFSSAEPVRTPPAVSPLGPPQHGYRVAPYTVQGRPGYRQGSQQLNSPVRANSMTMQPYRVSTSPRSPQLSDQSLSSRRMSMPVAKVERPDFHPLQETPSLQTGDGQLEKGPKSEGGISTKTSPSPDENNDLSSAMSKAGSSQQRQRPGYISNFPRSDAFGPLSMALPMESQQMMNPAMLPQDDFGAALMGGSEAWMYGSGAFGASNPGEMLKADSNFHPSTTGMNSTLLPEDGQVPPIASAPEKSDAATAAPVHGLDFGQFLDFGGSSSSNAPSGAGTPGSDPNPWKDLVGDSTWPEGASVS